MADELQLTRLELSAFSEAARKHVDPAGPPPVRLMAAKAMVPLAPGELVAALYQLTFDPDPKIREAANQSLAELPNDMLEAAVAANLDARVLHLLARAQLRNDGLLERLVLNQATSDATVAMVAGKASERIAELVAGLHVRLLRYSPIIEALYLNPHARMSTVDKILDLARRNNVQLAGLPGLQEAVKAAAEAPVDSAITDDDFISVAAESVARPEDEIDTDAVNQILDGERTPETEEEQKRMSRWQLIDRMSPSQKIRLAMIGNAEDRSILLRDSRRIVHMAAVTSPKITPGEASKLAANRSLPDGVISYIARKRDWVRFYPVIVGLVNNPKCPLSESVGFLKMLRPNDLALLRRNKNVPTQLARQASAFHAAKTGGGHKS